MYLPRHDGKERRPSEENPAPTCADWLSWWPRANSLSLVILLVIHWNASYVTYAGFAETGWSNISPVRSPWISTATGEVNERNLAC